MTWIQTRWRASLLLVRVNQYVICHSFLSSTQLLIYLMELGLYCFELSRLVRKRGSMHLHACVFLLQQVHLLAWSICLFCLGLSHLRWGYMGFMSIWSTPRTSFWLGPALLGLGDGQFTISLLGFVFPNFVGMGRGFFFVCSRVKLFHTLCSIIVSSTVELFVLEPNCSGVGLEKIIS